MNKNAITKLQGIIITVIIIIAGTAGTVYWYLSRPVEQEEKIIKIGAVYPLTGAVTRRSIRDAIEFFTEKIINGPGGIQSLGGAKVRIYWGDCQTSPDLARAETERLITQEGVVMVLGSWWSSLTYATQEVCNRYQVPNFVWDSSSPTLLARGFEWYFMNWPHDGYWCKLAIDWLVSELTQRGLMTKIKRIAIIVENSLFGRTTREEWLKNINELKEKGVINWEIVEDITFSAPIVDITPELLRIKAADPDIAFICPMAPADCVKFIRTLVDLNYFPPIMVSNPGGWNMHDFWDVEDARKAAVYLFGRNPVGLPDQLEKLPEMKAIADEYRSIYGYFEELVFAAYNSFIVLKKALERAGQMDPEMKNFPRALRDAMRETRLSLEEGLVWPVEFNEQGYNIHVRGCMGQIQPDPKKTGDVAWFTIYPPDLATVSAIIPDPRSRGL